MSAKVGVAWQGAPGSRRPSHARMSTVWGERETAHSRRSRVLVQCAFPASRADAGTGARFRRASAPGAAPANACAVRTMV